MMPNKWVIFLNDIPCGILYPYTSRMKPYKVDIENDSPSRVMYFDSFNDALGLTNKFSIELPLVIKEIQFRIV